MRKAKDFDKDLNHDQGQTENLWPKAGKNGGLGQEEIVPENEKQTDFGEQ